jgi:GT2 family glycosyltransferase
MAPESVDMPVLGVVVVAFNSADVILDCLEGLLASVDVSLRLVVVDNASTDDTVALIRDWAAGRQVYVAPGDISFGLTPCAKPVPVLQTVPEAGSHSLTLIEAAVNGGFAAGVNIGLAMLAGCQSVNRFWILNPDCIVPPHTAHQFAAAPEPSGGFALMGGRVLYVDPPGMIQIDGGTINRRTGVTGNLGLGQDHAQTPPPDPAAIDFITGASMVASRRFYEAAGPMPEDYFLYYEESDWALQRGDLPLIYCEDGLIYHRAGTAIGSPTLGRPASPFSLYFKHRARLRFVRKYFPRNLVFAYAYSLAKALQLVFKGYPTEAWTILTASLDMQPSAEIRAKLTEEAARRAFGT